MSQAEFDPYHKWLGIPPAEQPPHYYRLLGIGVFEKDPEIIEYAADRIMGHLRTFQVGRHSAESQQLLNQVAAARVCLLDPVRKATYDAMLERLMEGSAGPPVPSGPSLPVAPPPLSAAPSVTPPPTVLEEIAATAWSAPNKGPTDVTRRKKPQQSLAVLMSLVAAVAVIVIVACVMFLSTGRSKGRVMRSGGEGEAHQTPDGAKAREPIVQPAKPSETSLPSEKFFKHRQGKPGTDKGSPEKAVVRAADKPSPKIEKSAVIVERPPPGRGKSVEQGRDPGVAVAQVVPGQPPTERPASANEMADELDQPPLPLNVDPAIGALGPARTVSPAGSPRSEGSQRRAPAPNRALEKRLMAQIRETEGVASLHAVADKGRVARDFLLKTRSQAPDSGERFAYLRVAADLAGAAGELAVAEDALTQIESSFDVDALELKRNVVRGWADEGEEPASIEAVVALARKVAGEASSAGRFDLAEDAAEAAYRAAQKPAGVKLRREANQLKTRAARTRARYAEAQKAKEALQSQPADPDANFALGVWHWAVRGDWTTGMPFVLKSGQPELRELARREQTAPATAERRMSLAEAWWNWAQAQTGDEKAAGLDRAEFWYRIVLESPDAGAIRGRAEKRLSLISTEETRQGR